MRRFCLPGGLRVLPIVFALLGPLAVAAPAASANPAGPSIGFPTAPVTSGEQFARASGTAPARSTDK